MENITSILITVGLQAILVICGFFFFYWKESLSKRNILRNKKEVTIGMIYDKEIEVEQNWILFREAEKKFLEAKATILENENEINEEKKKTPIDLERIKNLRFENEKLGFTGNYKKDGKMEFNSHRKNPETNKEESTEISKAENKMENHRGQITQAVMEREYLKVQLRAIKRLMKKGYARNFEKFGKEEGMQEEVIKGLK